MTYYCSECNKECDAVEMDFGIGPYEFWGFMGSHHNWQWVSQCCEGDLLDQPIEEENDDGQI